MEMGIVSNRQQPDQKPEIIFFLILNIINQEKYNRVDPAGSKNWLINTKPVTLSLSLA